jgi:hypothetical protein
LLRGCALTVTVHNVGRTLKDVTISAELAVKVMGDTILPELQGDRAAAAEAIHGEDDGNEQDRRDLNAEEWFSRLDRLGRPDRC